MYAVVHEQVHQHQDRGETFQCDLCPFTSSRHFSLKLHMRCHQHFPRPDVKVKDEPVTDNEEGEGSLVGEAGGSGDIAMVADMDASPSPLAHVDGGRPRVSPGESSNHIQIKEEPQERDVSGLSPFSLGRERPASSTSSLELPGLKASPGGPTAAALFSPDITTKTATDLLIKLSGRTPSCNTDELQVIRNWASLRNYILGCLKTRM